MTEHDVGVILRELRALGVKVDATRKQSADQHMSVQHEIRRVRDDIADVQDRVSALERDKTRHSGFIRAQSESHHEIIVEQRELEKAHEKLEEDHRKVKGMFERVATQMATPQNTVIGFLILTFRDDVRHYVEAIVKFIGSLFGN